MLSKIEFYSRGAEGETGIGFVVAPPVKLFHFTPAYCPSIIWDKMTRPQSRSAVMSFCHVALASVLSQHSRASILRVSSLVGCFASMSSMLCCGTPRQSITVFCFSQESPERPVNRSSSSGRVVTAIIAS